MKKFAISNNGLYAVGGKAIGDALNGNKVMTELNLAGNDMGLDKSQWGGGSADMSGVIAIGNAIPTMGALTTITFGDDEAVTMNTSMTEADFSGKYLEASGAIIVAAFLPKCQ